MNLPANASHGYAMAALLIGLSIMAVLLGAALPVWSHMIRREKEEELVFRGNQYARAINLYQRRHANASPPNLDILIEQRLLRKKFKDPLSPGADGEFQLLYLNSVAGSRGTSFGARGGGSTAPPASGGAARGTSMYSTTPSGGIVGVTSKNTGTSIRVYNGKTRYSEWEFIGIQQTPQAGAAGAGRGRGGPGGTGPQGSPLPSGRRSGQPQPPIRY